LSEDVAGLRDRLGGPRSASWRLERDTKQPVPETLVLRLRTQGAIRAIAAGRREGREGPRGPGTLRRGVRTASRGLWSLRARRRVHAQDAGRVRGLSLLRRERGPGIAARLPGWIWARWISMSSSGSQSLTTGWRTWIVFWERKYRRSFSY